MEGGTNEGEAVGRVDGEWIDEEEEEGLGRM